MNHLILVRHARPIIDPHTPAATWPLASESAAACVRLGHALSSYLPALLVSSPEPKARSTAHHLATQWGVAVQVQHGLEEQHRHSAPFLSDDAAFQAAIRTLFARPSELVFGEETADAAYQRFAAAMSAVRAAHPHTTLVVVTHGTVMSLYLSRHAQVDAVNLWQSLGFPAAVVLNEQTQQIEAQFLQP